MLLASACAPDPQRAQLGMLIDRLNGSRMALVQPQPQLRACDDITDVDSRLEGEPGLTDVKPTWQQLRDATDALLASCGQAVLLAQPFEPTYATEQARGRWQAGLARQLAAACGALQDAAQSLGKPQPC